MQISDQSITILDGGTGRELKRLGAPFRQPEWSALALLDGPEYVLKCHENYIAAGADVITTNSYAVVPFHLGQTRFDHQGMALASLAGKLAADAKRQCKRVIRVAGSLPPVMGSYRPDLYEHQAAIKILSVLAKALDPWVDIWLGETLGCLAEAQVLLAELESYRVRPIWLSFTLDDRSDPQSPLLRSGEPVEKIASIFNSHKIDALLFNCSQPELMAGALASVRQIDIPSSVRLGVYANAFPPHNGEEAANEKLHDIRADLTPERYAQFAQKWQQLGASIIGGCCGIGPEHIQYLAQKFSHE